MRLMPATKETPVQAPIRTENPSFRPKIGTDTHAPLTSERAPSVRKEFSPAPNTAMHELLHAIVLESYGYVPEEVSVKREGNSLGRVKVGGWVNPVHFQVFAAASSFAFEGYEPRGTGSDRFQIGMIARQGGHSHEDAEARASRIINGFLMKYGPEYLHKAAHLLHERQSVSGSVKGILAQAAYEIKMERGETDDEIQFMFRHQRKQEEKATEEEVSVEPKRTTVLETLTGDRSRISLYEGTILAGVETYCTRCGGRGNDHTQECIYVTPTSQPDTS